MSKRRWTMVRVPPDLAIALHAEAEQIEQSYAEGRRPLPQKFRDHVPLHYVIADLLRERAAHRERARKR